MHVCTYKHTCLHTYEQRRYIGSDPRALSAHEYAGARWFNPAQPPCFTPFHPGQSRFGYIVSGKGWATGGGTQGGRLSPCLYRTIFDDSVARHTSVFTDCRFMNKVDAQASARAVCGFTISRSRSDIHELTDNRWRPKRWSKVCSNIVVRYRRMSLRYLWRKALRYKTNIIQFIYSTETE